MLLHEPRRDRDLGHGQRGFLDADRVNVLQHTQHLGVAGQHGLLAPAVGAAEGQAGDPPGMTQGKLLGNHAAHGDAENMRLLNVQAVEQPGRVVGKHRHRVRLVRLVTLTHAPVVKGDGAEGLGKGRDIPVPADRADGKAHDQKQRLATAVFFVVQRNPVGLEMRHGSGTPYR